MGGSDAGIWPLAIMGLPLLLLGGAMAWAKFRMGRVNKRADPGRPNDDPSRGM